MTNLGGEFNVVIFDPDDRYEYVQRWVDARTAIETAASYTTRPAAQIGIIRKVMVTDGGDSTVFLWEYGQGVVFPKRDTPVDSE